MSDNLSAALLISLLGMGIVFGIIILTWGIMAALTRIPPGKDELAEAQESEAEEAGAVAATLPDPARAAAAAVAVALALGQQARPVRARPRAEPATTAISAWQSVMRGRQLKQTYRRPRR